MKLSDIKGERVFDVVADIIEPISNIAADKTVSELFKRQKLPEGMSPTEFALERIKTAIPALLKNHKSDVIAILAVIEGVGVEEYTEALNLVKLTGDVVELLTDEVFIGLFPSARSQ